MDMSVLSQQKKLEKKLEETKKTEMKTRVLQLEGFLFFMSTQVQEARTIQIARETGKKTPKALIESPMG